MSSLTPPVRVEPCPRREPSGKRRGWHNALKDRTPKEEIMPSTASRLRAMLGGPEMVVAPFIFDAFQGQNCPSRRVLRLCI